VVIGMIGKAIFFATVKFGIASYQRA